MVKTVADIGEFGLIDRIHGLLEKEGVYAGQITMGIGDDAASFRPPKGYEILITCDSMVEGRHYLSEYITPEDLGRRAMVANISDIGAMGGTPLYALVSLALQDNVLVEYLEAMYRGFLVELNPFGAAIIGGNVTKSKKNLFIDITLIGKVKEGKGVHRSTAKPGDAIMVTGYPGQASAGLELLLHGNTSEDLRKHPLVMSYHRPSHRAREGEAIAASGYATAMIDTSDGFLGDLRHLCEQSGVGALLIQDKLPISEELRKAAYEMGRKPEDMVLQDSDDYELIITCPATHVDRIRSSMKTVSPIVVSEVGTITKATEGIHLKMSNGTKRKIKTVGWDHFSCQEEEHV